MNEETKELLLECKKAGYKIISIGVKDKRVPSSLEIEWYGEQKYHKEDGGYLSPSNGWYTGAIPQRDLEGKQTGWVVRPRVVCAEPKIRPEGRPLIWDICEKSNLTSGMLFRCFGCSETHNIRYHHTLSLGVYDLSEIQE